MFFFFKFNQHGTKKEHFKISRWLLWLSLHNNIILSSFYHSLSSIVQNCIYIFFRDIDAQKSGLHSYGYPNIREMNKNPFFYSIAKFILFRKGNFFIKAKGMSGVLRKNVKLLWIIKEVFSKVLKHFNWKFALLFFPKKSLKARKVKK